MNRRFTPEYGSPEMASRTRIRHLILGWIAILLVGVAVGLSVFGLVKLGVKLFHHVPIAGTVTSKQDNPAYTWIYDQPLYTSVCGGNPPTCQQVFTGILPVTEYEPEKFNLIVLTPEGKYRTAHVGRETYRETPVGAHFAEAGAK